MNFGEVWPALVFSAPCDFEFVQHKSLYETIESYQLPTEDFLTRQFVTKEDSGELQA